ncbi:A24 family peptidase [Paenibacillus sp.]|uniref:A24 family peptidase n=1 Tax=Paenibacillus sp. TaxID=58172 RepID=UPI002D6F9E33|nr:A24 family peptidase [Paenibacillus sp.]HZG84729.1 A24 family peptidase [Paenibacillus sp.]
MLTVVTIVFSALVFYLDLKYQVIPNKLTLPAIAAGWLLSWLHGALAPSLIGSLIGFFILLLPFVMGWIGGGDLKMLAALGALMGPSSFISAFFLGILIAGALSLLVLVKNRALLHMVKYMLKLPEGDRYRPISQAIPFGSCMSLAVFTLILMGLVV